jgi:uncharacterized protein (UPF0548 family)
MLSEASTSEAASMSDEGPKKVNDDGKVGLTPERQREILSEAIETARMMVRTVEDADDKRKWIFTLATLNRELNNVQRTLYTLGKMGRARKSVTDLGAARTSEVDVAAHG